MENGGQEAGLEEEYIIHRNLLMNIILVIYQIQNCKGSENINIWAQDHNRSLNLRKTLTLRSKISSVNKSLQSRNLFHLSFY